MKISTIVLGITFCMVTFSSKAQKTSPQFEEVIEAHGGLETWQWYSSVEFDLRDWPTGAETPRLNDRHRANLHNRKHLVEGENYSVGWDGEIAWVKPDIVAINTLPRFYLNGSLYFFGMPFVFKDNGANVRFEGKVSYRGEMVNRFTVNYDSGEGDAGNSFVLLTDARTNRLRLIHFDVEYPAVKGLLPRQSASFDEWQEISGLLVPSKITFRNWQGEDTKDIAGATFRFEDVRFCKDILSDDLFKKPEKAVVDTSNDPN